MQLEAVKSDQAKADVTLDGLDTDGRNAGVSRS